MVDARRRQKKKNQKSLHTNGSGQEEKLGAKYLNSNLTEGVSNDFQRTKVLKS